MASAPAVDVACFGEILWDIFESEPRGAEPIGRVFRREIGGAPANVAVALARVAVRSSLVGGIGEDAFGETLERTLAAEGVETKYLIKLPNRTGLTFVSRDERGEPTFLFYRHETADVSVTASRVTAPMAKAKWGLVGTSTLMNDALAAATRKFIDQLTKQGGNLVVDLNVREHMWSDNAQMKSAIGELAKKAALIKASEADLRALAGKRGMTWLEQHAPSAAWILTRGENGAAAVGAHGQVNAATKRVRCIDATGAGDAFLAGVLAVLVSAGAKPGSAEWKDSRVWSRALEVGHILGAKSVSGLGGVSGLVELDEARARIRSAKKC